VPLEQSKYILWSTEFKGNKKVLDEELLELIPFSQRANAKPFGLPITPRVWWYEFGKKNFKKEKNINELRSLNDKLAALEKLPNTKPRKIDKLKQKIDRKTINGQEEIAWFWRNIGEKEVIIDENNVKETSIKLNKFLIDIGFRDAKVSHTIVPQTNPLKVNVVYTIDENQPYVVDSVEYVSKDTILLEILKKDVANSVIKKGYLFDLRLVQKEKARIDNHLKSNGYYAFNARFVNHWATTSLGTEEQFQKEKKGILRFEILNPTGKNSHERYTLNKVYFKSFDPNVTSSEVVSPDTLEFDNITFIRLDKNIPVGLIRSRLLTNQNTYFDAKLITETQRQLSLFNQFAFASSQIKSLGNNSLSLEYFAPLLQKYTLGISPGINNIYNNSTSFFGFGVPVSLTARNKFKKLETIELSTRASYEGQPSPLNAGSALRGSLELGLNLNVTLPVLWPLKLKNNAILLKNPRTIFGLGYNYSEPFWGKRQNFKINTNYAIQLNKYTNLFVSLLDVNLINTVYFTNESGRKFYNSLLDLEKTGNNLKVTFDPQFVSSINSNLVYNDQNLSKPFANSRFFRLFFESGGTILNFLPDKNQIKTIEKLFPLNKVENANDSARSYFRFIKVNVDLRKNINLCKTSSYAYRLNFGVSNPYGSKNAMPYDKNFFIGGSNSIRAWAPRTLGTGSSPVDTVSGGRIIAQPGDILIETNLEYRKRLFHFAGEIQMAAFLDAGNVWKWHPINTAAKSNTANFEFNRFFKEIAVGTGLGIRWDLSYFMFRFDWGIKVIDPARKAGERFVLDDFTLRKPPANTLNPYGVNWNFGIGYPF
jgi:outer membrane protein insertion porin family